MTLTLNQLILEQRAEYSRLCALPIVDRQRAKQLREALQTPLIKVITGPRRVGKSCLCISVLRQFSVAYCNCEDDTFLTLSPTGDELLKALLEVYPSAKYFFIDEVQLLKNWGPFLNKLQRRGFNLIVTGSNAQLLSSELATSLTGRHMAIELLPLNFKEYLDLTHVPADNTTIEQQATLGRALTRYLTCGGFPEAYTPGLDRVSYLTTLVDSILLKDIARRYRIKRVDALYLLYQFLLSTGGSPLSMTSISEAAQLKYINTVKLYLSYILNAYLGFGLSPFSFSPKKRSGFIGKFYPIDTGIVVARTPYSNLSDGKLFETLIFLELVRRGFRPNRELFYFRSERSAYEVDFVVNQGGKVQELYQVCYSLQSEDVRQREIRAINEAGKLLRCDSASIITWESGLNSENRSQISARSQISIKVIPAIEWFLGDQSK